MNDRASGGVYRFCADATIHRHIRCSTAQTVLVAPRLLTEFNRPVLCHGNADAITKE